MSLQTVARSFYIIFLVILWTQNSLAYILDGKKCIAYEEVPEAPKIEVEHVQNITFNSLLKDKTRVKYGQHIKLICDIQFSSPMSLILWRGRSRNYTKGLSEDHKEFDIKSVNIDFHGQYITCEATLVSNPKIKKMYGTSIIISDLASPVISLTNTTTVMENDNITLTCKILRGIPAPRITWQMKSIGENEFKDMLVTSEDITIENASFKNAGQYKCIAKNVRGQATKTTEVFVQKAPVVIIKEVPKKTYSYGDTAEFTCKIEGYPLPNATWSLHNLANKHNVQDTAINWHEKRSKIKLHKLKKSDVYSCIAVNKIGTAMSSVNVTVLSPFFVHQHPKATTDVHYGTMNNIVCNITSAFPMRIKWFHRISSSQTIQIQDTQKSGFHISSDETRLTINSVDFDTVGNYTCGASLVDDENETIAFTTDVQIDDLAPPLLSDTIKMIVMETNWITLYCKITGGVPRPTLSWFVKRHGEVEFTELLNLSENLDIENITISEAGHYRCIAKNHVGKIFQNTEVLVRKAPITDIEEGSTIAVPYGSNNTFTCNVVAFPLPTITWEASSDEPSSSIKDEIKHEHLISSKFTVKGIRADNTYSCRAKNPLGEDTSRIQVTVLSPFIVHEHPSDKTNVHYAASKSLICNITTSFPMRIKWFYNDTEIFSSVDYTISSDETKLDIRSTNLDLIGNYTCEAYLVNDVHVNKVYTTDLQINDLQPPIITSFTGEGATITVNNLEELSLTCKIAGVPFPTLSWFLKRHGEVEFNELPAIHEDLDIKSIAISEAGQYRCTAKNLMGQTFQNIEVLVRKAPVTDIEEGSRISIPYGSNNTFRCNVVAYPLPTVTWEASSAEPSSSDKDEIKHEHLTSSKFTVEGIRADNTYSCRAKNPLGEDTSKIQVTVLSPLVVHEHPADKTYVHYAASKSLICNITTLFPMRIKWFYNDTEIHTSADYTISSDETKLDIRSTNLDLIGNYTCEAYLVNDVHVNEVFTTDLQIDDLQPPIITSFTGKGAPITVNNLEELSLTCKTAGVPFPTLSWFLKRHGETEFKELPAAINTELDIKNIATSEAGQYRCTAKNIMGQTYQNIEVLVRKAPVTDIVEGTTISVPYGSSNTFTCNVVAYPLPTITWEASKDEPSRSNEDEIKHEHLTSSKLTVKDIKADNTYSCRAKNPLGEDTSRIQVTVLSPFVVHKHPADKTYVHYAASKSLICNITTSFPMRIKWFYNSTEIHPSADYTISSDETKLDIRSTNLDLIGNYTCEAYLVNDVHVNKVFTTDLQIDDLEPPVITSFTGEGATITVKNLEELSLTCKAKGNPEPVISWQASTTASAGYQATGQGATVCSTNAGYNQAGIYKCTANNIVGSAEKTINVNVV